MSAPQGQGTSQPLEMCCSSTPLPHAAQVPLQPPSQFLLHPAAQLSPKTFASATSCPGLRNKTMTKGPESGPKPHDRDLGNLGPRVLGPCPG